MLTNWNIWPFSYTFSYPHWFWLLLLLPVLAVYFFKKNNKSNFSARVSHLSTDQKSMALTWVDRYRQFSSIIKLFIFILLVTALTGPFSWDSPEGRQENFKNGIDIVFALDVSLSMYARDFEPNRLDAAKRVAMDFVAERPGDRIGLVVYAGEAYTSCPPTLDHQVLLDKIASTSGEYIDGGTAIGVGLGTAVNRLRAKSEGGKVIILLTDGTNNSGEISPEKAAELAKAKGIRVYTIGMGTKGEALSPIPTAFGIQWQMAPVDIDEDILKKIAFKTKGSYFRATDQKSLVEIYEKIEKLEKAKFLDRVYKNEPPSDPSSFLNWAIVLSLILVFYSLLQFKYAGE
ncbi:MAG: VWA domain-containing protein [Flavobacteriales bacterium]